MEYLHYSHHAKNCQYSLFESLFHPCHQELQGIMSDDGGDGYDDIGNDGPYEDDYLMPDDMDDGPIDENQQEDQEGDFQDDNIEEDHDGYTNSINPDFNVIDSHQTGGATSTGAAIDKSARITTRYLTKYERARLLGTRALQLSMNAPPLVDIEDETDPLKIAMKELREKKIPLIIRRFLPDNSYEDWSLDELIID